MSFFKIIHDGNPPTFVFFLHHLAALLGTETEAVFEYPAEIMLRREAALFGDFPHQIRLWTQQHRPRLRQPFFVDQFAERTVDLFFDDPRQIGSGNMKLFRELIERKLAVRRPAINFLQHLRDHPAVLMLRDHDPGGCDLLLEHRRAAIQHGH